MTKQTEALRMAIEALNDSLTRFSTFNEMQHEAIQACKDALEQPAQEPVMIEDCNAARQIKEWYEKQERLGEPFEKILNDNLWDLYESETEQPAKEQLTDEGEK